MDGCSSTSRGLERERISRENCAVAPRREKSNPETPATGDASEYAWASRRLVHEVSAGGREVAA